MRTRGLALAAVLGLVWTMAPMSPVEAAEPALAPVFNQEIYGDFAVIGNSVLDCPPDGFPGATHPAAACRDAENRKGTGAGAQNNGHSMRLIPGGSTANLVIPAGARVVYAGLDWSAATGRPQEGPLAVPCGKDTAGRPPGDPATQPVRLKVGDRPAVSLGPDRFSYTVDELGSLGQLDGQYYSARSEVTGELAGIPGGTAVPITVSDVWAQQGFDCYGGWSLTAVWAYDKATEQAPARKQVVVYKGHLHVPIVDTQLTSAAAGLKFAGGTGRIGLVAYEGDWAGTGNGFLVNGRQQAAQGPFFNGHADGAARPNHLNNLSVDAKTIDVAEADLRSNSQLGFAAGKDAYLLTTVAIAAPRPELSISIATPPPAHAGDPITYRVTLRNPGGAPAKDIVITAGGCSKKVDQLAPGATQVVECSIPAPDKDTTVPITVTGQNLLGDALSSAAAGVPVRVVHPGLSLGMTAEPANILTGQTVTFTVVAKNTGDTTLSGLALTNQQGTSCAKDVGTLEPGKQLTLTCTVEAGDEGFANAVRLAGRDEAGKPIAATAQAAFTVLHPKTLDAKAQLAFQGREEEVFTDGGYVAALSIILIVVMLCFVPSIRTD
ncbi:hypothetical protein D5S17_17020 [Pseudonocardiaceae bacterium YIM PH 21723]|nr:hypothetical protein D5S17_17020 [Pseudonocardiaceae bacterium YIM PH 21723]